MLRGEMNHASPNLISYAAEYVLAPSVERLHKPGFSYLLSFSIRRWYSKQAREKCLCSSWAYPGTAHRVSFYFLNAQINHAKFHTH